MNVLIQKNADYCVSVDGLCMTAEVARENARQLIECAHACDKLNRRSGYRSDPGPAPTCNPQDEE